MPKRSHKAPTPTDEYLEFGRRLTQLLVDSGQDRHGAGAYLAKKYGVSVVTANSWLKGEYRPNTVRARRIAEDHGTSFDELYFGRRPAQSAPPLSDRERALVNNFRQMEDSDKQSIERLAESLAKAGPIPVRRAAAG